MIQTERLILRPLTETDAEDLFEYLQRNIPSQKLCEKLGIRRKGEFLDFVSFVNNPDSIPKYENTIQHAI